MNRVYRVIWNGVAGCWQAVAETARAKGKSDRQKTDSSSFTGNASLSPALRLAVIGLAATGAWAAPQGGQVTAGNAIILKNGVTTTINQPSQNAAINWQSFSVGKSEAVRFNQPNASAITLNRVTGTESSQILGSLTANGRVFILNPNGVLFGNGAQVNVGGLIASTGKMNDADFMAGNYKITDAQDSVINAGNINAAQGGVVALIAPVVQNTGTIAAPQGSVLLAGAQAVTLKLQDGSLIGYTLDQGSLQALVENGGIIQAEGGHVVLTTKGLDALSKATINHSGVIEAQTVSSKNGVVELLGDMEIGEVNLAGKIDASAPKGGDGGFVETSAAKVNIEDSFRVTTAATRGKTGTWLIDPNDYTIAPSGGDITGNELSTYLSSNNVAIQTATMGTSGGHGDIFVNDDVSWSSPTELSLIAERNIAINRAITGSNANSEVTLFWGIGESGSTLLFDAPLSAQRVVLLPNNGGSARQTASGVMTTNMLVAAGSGEVVLEANNRVSAVRADVSNTFWLINRSPTLTVASSATSISGVSAWNVGLNTNGDLVLDAPVIATGSGNISVGSTTTVDTYCTDSCVRPHVVLEAGRFTNNVGANAISVQPGEFWSLITGAPSDTTLNGLTPDHVSFDGRNIRGDVLVSSNRVFYRDAVSEDESEISAYEPAPGITSAVYASYQLTGQGTTINQGILVASESDKSNFSGINPNEFFLQFFGNEATALLFGEAFGTFDAVVNNFGETGKLISRFLNSQRFRDQLMKKKSAEIGLAVSVDLTAEFVKEILHEAFPDFFSDTSAPGYLVDLAYDTAVGGLSGGLNGAASSAVLSFVSTTAELTQAINLQRQENISSVAACLNSASLLLSQGIAQSDTAKGKKIMQTAIDAINFVNQDVLPDISLSPVDPFVPFLTLAPGGYLSGISKDLVLSKASLLSGDSSSLSDWRWTDGG